jgi:hypothetical protein
VCSQTLCRLVPVLLVWLWQRDAGCRYQCLIQWCQYCAFLCGRILLNCSRYVSCMAVGCWVKISVYHSMMKVLWIPVLQEPNTMRQYFYRLALKCFSVLFRCVVVGLCINYYTRWFKYDRDYLCVNKSVCPGHIWTTLYIVSHGETNIKVVNFLLWI